MADGVKIRQVMAGKSTDELVKILREHDTKTYVEETFNVVKQLLEERASVDEAASTALALQASNQSSADTEEESGGFFSLKKFISPALIRFDYSFGVILIFLFGLGSIKYFMDLLGEFLGLLVGIISIMLAQIFWRVYHELLILFFNIHDRLVSIDKKLSKKE